jgi:hypothetical protein
MKGETEPILKKDAMTLWASAGGDRDHRDPLTISRGFRRFFDIGFVAGTHLHVASYEFEIRHPPPLGPGTYKLRVAASGNNFHPVTRKLKIRFDDANTVKVSSCFTLRFVLAAFARRHTQLLGGSLMHITNGTERRPPC